MNFSLPISWGLKPVVVALAVVLITIAGGIIHGRLEHRWGSSQDLVTLAKRLETLPTEVGSWRLEQSSEISAEVQETLRCAGYVNRTYIDRRTGAAARVAVLLGPTTPIAIHTPEICYSSRASVIHQAREHVSLAAIPDRHDEFWHLVFRPASGAPEDLHVFYAWSKGDVWQAPESQRLAFIGAPWLYKIQLAVRSAGDARTDGRAVGEEFLSQFVPALRLAMTRSDTPE